MGLLATTRRSDNERLLVATFAAVDVLLALALALRWRWALRAIALRSLLGLVVFGGLALLRHEPVGAGLALAVAAGLLLLTLGSAGGPRTAAAAAVLCAVLTVEVCGLYAVVTGDAILALPIYRSLGWVEGQPVELVTGRRLPYQLRLEPGHWVYATAALHADEDADVHLVWPRRSAHLVVRAFDAPGAGGFDLSELQHRLEGLLADTEFLEAVDLGGDFEGSRLIRVHSRTPDFDEDGWLGLFTRGDHGFLVSAATPSRNFPLLSATLRAAVTSFTFDLPPPPTIPQDVVERVKRAVVLVKTASGSGSGFVVDVVGGMARVLTNAHVVQRPADAGRDELGVVFTDGAVRTLQPAQVVHRDTEADLALLEAPVGTARPPRLLLHTVRMASAGLPLFVVGFPLGLGASATAAFPPPTVNAGRLAGEPEATGPIRVDVAINPGNSGGPVVDVTGAVRGVAMAHIRGSDTSFLVPAEEVGRFLGHPAWLGWSTVESPEPLPVLPVVAGQRDWALQATVLVEAGGKLAPGVLVPSAGAALVLTSAEAVHAVDGGTRVRLRPGFDDERAVSATLLTRELTTDLALLSLAPDAGAPTPLLVGAAGPLAETAPLDLAGFLLTAPGGRAPGHARAVVRPAALSARKRDRTGRLVALSVEAGALPDFTAGPVLAPDGKLVGFARPHRDASSSLFEVTAAERIADFLDGSPRSRRLAGRDGWGGPLRLPRGRGTRGPPGTHRAGGHSIPGPAPAGAARGPGPRFPAAGGHPAGCPWPGLPLLPAPPMPAGPTAFRLFTETARGRHTDIIYPFHLSAGPGVTESLAFGDPPSAQPEPLLLPPGWAGPDCTPGDVATCSRACKRKRGAACYLLGAAYDARGTPELAERPYRQACERGVGLACVTLAPRLPTTVQLLERACWLGQAEACTRAASFAERPGGVYPAHLSALFRRGCSLGDPRACLELAQNQLASPAPAEAEAAGGFLLQACERWEADGCLRLAQLLQSGSLPTRGPLTALALFDRSCAMGEAHGCAALQQMGLPAGGPLR